VCQIIKIYRVHVRFRIKFNVGINVGASVKIGVAIVAELGLGLFGEINDFMKVPGLYKIIDFTVLLHIIAYTYTHTRLTDLCPGLPR